MTLDAAKAALAHLDLIDDGPALKATSRDFFWYSPRLKDWLDGVQADFVVHPRSVDDVREVLRVCFAEDVPVTTRGAGTGNYGQAMPLAGGCVMHLRHMDRVIEVGEGRVVAEPGIVMRDLDAQLAASKQELRMFPSTYATATLGGFIAGGSGGVGSVRWGALRDPGNILRLRVATMEAEPRLLDFTGEELARVSHAYGTNGIIVEVEVPTAPKVPWVEGFVAFPTFESAAAFGAEIANADGLALKLVCVVEAPAPAETWQRFRGKVEAAETVVALMAAPNALPALGMLLARAGAHRWVYRSDRDRWEREPGPAYEYGWNHTTLRALKVDPAWTYLQVRYAGEDLLDRIAAIRARFPAPELVQHLEAMREGGRLMMAGLTLVIFSTVDRLEEIIRVHEEMGCMVFNPHRYTLEEGGRQTVDDRQLAFKREADPKGLLNPGKMIAWEDPDWDFSRPYAWPGLRG